MPLLDAFAGIHRAIHKEHRAGSEHVQTEAFGTLAIDPVGCGGADFMSVLGALALFIMLKAPITSEDLSPSTSTIPAGRTAEAGE